MNKTELRKGWCADYNKKLEDIMNDDKGDFIIVEMKHTTPYIKKLYLPTELQKQHG